jgi:hypothetical protein
MHFRAAKGKPAILRAIRKQHFIFIAQKFIVAFIGRTSL